MRAAWLPAVLLAASPALAEETPDSRLQATQSELSTAKAHAKELESQRAKAETDLKTTQQDLVQLSDAIRKNERGLLDAEDKLAILNRQAEQKEEQLDAKRQQLTALIAAAIRLSHTPPEAALMLPHDFDDAAKAARVLASLTASIHEEGESLQAQLVELEDLRQKVRRGREKMSDSQQLLASQREALNAKLSERQALSSRLAEEQADAKKRVAELARKAKNMQELLTGLEKTRAASKARRGAHPREFAHGKGKMTPPAAGTLAHRFGESIGPNETSRGITLKTRANAPVVAPFDGEIVFSGPFLHYGTMVILRHDADHHTLLAGFSRVNVSVGQFLLEGEPIGVMGDAERNELYVELRERNQPVDPASWIADLKP